MKLKRALALLLVCLLLPTGAWGMEMLKVAPINRRVDTNTAKTLNYQPEAARLRTDTLVISTPDLLGETNPFWARTTGDGYAVSLMFDELLFASNDGTVGAGVAAYTTSEDGKEWRFTVREGVQYADGTQVTSDDFINALYLLLMPGYDGVYDITRAGIVGVEDYLAGEAQTISGIVRTGDRTFTVATKTGNQANLIYLAIPALRVSLFGDMRRPDAMTDVLEAGAFYRDALKEVRAADAASMAYGQYLLVSLVEGEKATLVKHEGYWRGTPYIGTVELLVIPAGQELDAVMDGRVDMASMLGSVDAVDTAVDYNTGFVNLYTWRGDVVGYLGMDLENPLFADLRVRQALTVGFDREAARQRRIERYGNVPTMLLFDTFSPDTEDMLGEQYPFDRVRASALLDEAGWTREGMALREKDGQTLSFTLIYNEPNPVIDSIVQQMQSDYAELGIELKTEAMGFEALLDRIDSGDYEMYFQARRLPSSALLAADLFAGDSHLNGSGYKSEMTDRLMAMATNESDPARQTVVDEVFYQQLYLDLPFIPLYRRFEFLLVNARVMNVTITTAHDITTDVYRLFLTDTLEGQW